MGFLFQRVAKQAEEQNISKNKTAKSKKWFREKSREIIKDPRPKRLIERKSAEVARFILPGEMYLFGYRALHAKTLPYYDKFPLIMMVEETSSGFMGINFHYLPIRQRAILMDRMYALLTDNNFDEATRLQIKYETLKRMHRLWKPCFKRYLRGNVNSNIIKIHSSEWDTILTLPLERFSGAHRNKVYADSKIEAGY